MDKAESFQILLDNLSPIYILTSLLTIFTIVLTCFCMKCLNACPDPSKMENIHNDSSEINDKISSESPEGLLAKLRSAKLKKLEESLTEEQKIEEKNIEQEQLAAIFKLLKEQKEELDETDLKEQLKLYR